MTKFLGAVAALAWLSASAAWADDDPGRSVRLIGAAPAAEDPAAKVFVLDLLLAKGDGAFQQTISGWYAALPPDVASGEVSGTCVRVQCVVNIDVTNAKLSLTGDFTGAGGAPGGGFALADDDGKITAQGAASFSPLTDAVPGVGVLAAPNAIDAPALKAILEWNGETVSSGDAPSGPPEDTERDALAAWQNSQSEPMTGLITVSDLAALRHNAEAAKATAGWTKIGDDKRGWSAGYPAALLPKAGASGAERHFSSADGKASLVVAMDPPLSDDDFSALVDKQTADAPGRSSSNYTRVNGDMTQTYVQGGDQVTLVFHNRPDAGLGRLVFTRPADKSDAWNLYDTVIPSNFVVPDDLKAP